MALVKADFYFGALLSQMVNSGFAPAIIEEGEKRRVYSLSNNYGDYKIYAKYVSKPDNDKLDSKRWDFTFSPEELANIQKEEDINQYIFAFVCGLEELIDSELVFLTNKELIECAGYGYQTNNHRISVKLVKGRRNFDVYGTGLDDKQEGKVTSKQITRNLKNRLAELSAVVV